MEIWKDIKGYEGLYQVSNKGRVKSLSRYSFGIGRSRRKLKERILKPGLTGSDVRKYLSVVLYKLDVRKTRKVHQLVAESFLDHIPNGMSVVVDHIDQNKENNKLSNLRIVSNRINISKHSRPKTSKYTGVHWDKSRNKWRSTIVINKKAVFLGRYDNEYDAHLAYQKALKELL